MSEVKRIPAVTLLLIAANIAAAFAVAFNPALASIYGFDAMAPSALDAFLCIFLHAHLIHLLGNMVFLAAVGPAVEFAAGAWRFLSVYFFGGVCGVLLHWILATNQGNADPLIGASGAIAACAAFYSIRYMHLRVPLLPNVSVPIIAIVAAWLGLQVLGAFVRLGSADAAVSYWAHIGGFGAGLILSLFFKAPALASVHFGHDVLEKMNTRGPAAVAAAAQHHLEKHPNDLKALWELADAQKQLGESGAEAESLLRVLSLEDDGRHVQALKRLSESGLLQKLPAHRRTRMAEQVGAQHPDVAASLLRSVIATSDADPQKPEAMLALAELQRTSSPAAAEALIKELFAKFPLHPAADLAKTKGWNP